ncbi:fructosamine kinase family protein [Rhizosphaericola mali]|uniref:Fructosamine kinase family protein n=1 Tax=Rhizosphaericola mali TaxID=2545455 RepID=A0A5P2G7X6_9BACT|nr:fructosamine kinase family protein [Rhizosphaericola mali]QES90389.1 fructosamine kinase family protein [Rhizosphaericola mali]
MQANLQNYIAQQISENQNIDFTDTRFSIVYGGDINETGVLYNDDFEFFVKINQNKPVDFFEKEVHGLDTLRHAKHTLKIPTPYLHGTWDRYSFLVMEYLQEDYQEHNVSEKLGIGLAELHQNIWDKFGLSENNYLGSQPQDNEPKSNWAEFYAERRLIPMSIRAMNNGYFSNTDMNKMENLCEHLPQIFPNEAPALIHGDLWNGNYGCVVPKQPSIFDPAIYYGNREMDIAMTLLFGGFDAAFYDGYLNTFPLQKGWQSRVEICQLYPLLMHLNHFGRSYYPPIQKVLEPF